MAENDPTVPDVADSSPVKRITNLTNFGPLNDIDDRLSAAFWARAEPETADQITCICKQILQLLPSLEISYKNLYNSIKEVSNTDEAEVEWQELLNLTEGCLFEKTRRQYHVHLTLLQNGTDRLVRDVMADALPNEGSGETIKLAMLKVNDNHYHSILRVPLKGIHFEIGYHNSQMVNTVHSSFTRIFNYKEGTPSYSEIYGEILSSKLLSGKGGLEDTSITFSSNIYEGDKVLLFVTKKNILMKTPLHGHWYYYNLGPEVNSASLRMLENFSFVIEGKTTDGDDYFIVIRSYSQYHESMKNLNKNVAIGNWYLARRAYENSRKCFPELPFPCLLFLDKLAYSSQKHLKKRVALDLYNLGGYYKSVAMKEGRLNFNKRCKKRLFIGEGNFSYTQALINKHEITHEQLAKAITATELYSEDRINNEDDPEFPGVFRKEVKEHIRSLRHKGVSILFEIDGTEIKKEGYTVKNDEGARFRRIHWNCPYAGQYPPQGQKEMKKFFSRCSELQSDGDRIHVTLMCEYASSISHFGIVLASESAGYRLMRKRNFRRARYPGYYHTKNNGWQYYANSGSSLDQKREYVFIKDGSSAINDVYYSKIYKIEKSEYICSTDEDSSDYYASSSDENDPCKREIKRQKIEFD